MSWSAVRNVDLRLQTSSASRAYSKQPKPQALLRKPQICFYSFPFPLLLLWQTRVPMSTEILGHIRAFVFVENFCCNNHCMLQFQNSLALWMVRCRTSWIFLSLVSIFDVFLNIFAYTLKLVLSTKQLLQLSAFIQFKLKSTVKIQVKIKKACFSINQHKKECFYLNI